LSDYDNEANSNEKIAVKTAQLVRSLPVAPPEDAAAEPAVVVGVLVLGEDPVEEGALNVLIPLGVELVAKLETLPFVGAEAGAEVGEVPGLEEGAPGSEPLAEGVPPPPPMDGGEDACDGS